MSVDLDFRRDLLGTGVHSRQTCLILCDGYSLLLVCCTGNVVVVGGSSNITGLPERLQKEINSEAMLVRACVRLYARGCSSTLAPTLLPVALRCVAPTAGHEDAYCGSRGPRAPHLLLARRLHLGQHSRLPGHVGDAG